MTYWEECLRQGDEYVRLYLSRCCDLSGWEVTHAPAGQFKDWDAHLRRLEDGYETTVEVKSDTLSKKTGNIAIEFACSGKPSGITATKAMWWVHFTGPDEYIQIPTRILRKFIRKTRYWRIVNGGDGGRAEMYLFDKSVFERYLKPVPPCSEEPASH